MTDRGVAMLRRRIRLDINNLAKGIEPLPLQPTDGPTIPTMGGDTILRVPRTNQDDRQLILDLCRKVAAAYTETMHLPDGERRAAITAMLVPLNTADATQLNPDHGKLFEFKTVA